MKLEITLPDDVVARIDAVGDRSEFIAGAVIRMLAEIGRRDRQSLATDDDGPEFSTVT